MRRTVGDIIAESIQWAAIFSGLLILLLKIMGYI